MILDKHGKVIVSTHDVATLDEPVTETQQETNKIIIIMNRRIILLLHLNFPTEEGHG